MNDRQMDMRRHNVSALALALLSVWGCTEKSDPPGGSIAGVGGVSGAEAAGSFAPTGGATGGATAGAAAGGTAGTIAGMTSGGVGGVGSPQGGIGGIGGMAAATGGSAAEGGVGGGDAGSMVPAEIPDPVTEPYAWGFGLGVSDMPAAIEFYTEVMGVTVEKEVVRSDRTETILYAAEAQRGARLILMKFNDNRETRKITAKLVWQASTGAAINRAAADYPDYVSRLTFLVYQFDGPDTYIQEVGNIFDTEGGAIDVPYLVALGFSVSDLAASRAFYNMGLGMEEASVGSFSVTDATGSGSITEYSERHPAGAGIVLQAWTPARNSMNNPVKVVLFVPDAQATADAVVAGGGSIIEPAARTAVYDNRLLIVAKDLDGYELELVQ